ncbi:MAG TPA: PilZ domain-containing protein [Spirochaetia bacterium]|nr:PilZ domain-containing protein [Spirochaetia bacterium]
MKALIVIEKEETSNALKRFLKPRGYDFIHYKNPVKALDNIEEIEPDLVVFSAEDFPRHWKPFISFLRNIRSKEETIFILLKGPLFDFEEGAKASFLGVNGIVKESLDDRLELNQFEELITRYGSLPDGRGGLRYVVRKTDDIELIMNHPTNFKLISGSVLDVSLRGLSFKPDDPQITLDIPEESIIPSASIRIEDQIFSTSLHVLRNNQILAMLFKDLPEDGRNALVTYINESPRRALAGILRK